MKVTIVATLLAVVLAASSAHGWTLTYRDPSGRTTVTHGDLNKPCTPLYHTREGGLVDLQRAHSRGCCVEVWTGNTRCLGIIPAICRARVKRTTKGPSSFRVSGCS
jgi:hypothetical protein